jgi:hypothetical protein
MVPWYYVENNFDTSYQINEDKMKISLLFSNMDFFPYYGSLLEQFKSASLVNISCINRVMVKRRTSFAIAISTINLLKLKGKEFSRLCLTS